MKTEVERFLQTKAARQASKRQRMSEGQRNAQRRRAGKISASRKTMSPLFKTNERAQSLHTGDCAWWCDEPCNCAQRFDPDREMERREV